MIRRVGRRCSRRNGSRSPRWSTGRTRVLIRLPRRCSHGSALHLPRVRQSLRAERDAGRQAGAVQGVLAGRRVPSAASRIARPSVPSTARRRGGRTAPRAGSFGAKPPFQPAPGDDSDEDRLPVRRVFQPPKSPVRPAPPADSEEEHLPSRGRRDPGGAVQATRRFAPAGEGGAHSHRHAHCRLRTVRCGAGGRLRKARARWAAAGHTRVLRRRGLLLGQLPEAPLPGGRDKHAGGSALLFRPGLPVLRRAALGGDLRALLDGSGRVGRGRPLGRLRAPLPDEVRRNPRALVPGSPRRPRTRPAPTTTSSCS